jgi:PKD repeat protein
MSINLNVAPRTSCFKVLNLRQLNALKSSMLLILTMMLSVGILIPTPRAADTIVLSISPQTQTVGIGETFNVSIMISIPSSLPAVGVQFIVTWNSTFLTGDNITEILYHSITPESEWGNIAQYLSFINNSAGGGLGAASYAFTWYRIPDAIDAGYAPITGDHEVAVITFTGASTGYSPLQFALTTIGDNNANELPSSGVNGSMVVGNPRPAITVVSPLNDSYSKVPVNLTVAVTKRVSWIGYSVDDQANVTLTTNVTFTSNLIQVSQGQHSLVVYANDSSGQMASSDRIHFTAVVTPPTINLAVSPQSSDAAAELVFGAYRWRYNFNASGSHAEFSNISAYFWDFGDGTNATDVAVTHEFRQAGTYNVTLTVTDLAGNTATQATAITNSPVSSIGGLSLGLLVAILIPVIWVPTLVFYAVRTKRKSKKV